MAKWEGPDEGLQAVGRHPHSGAAGNGPAHHPIGKRPDPAGKGHERAGGLGDNPADAVADKALGGLKDAGKDLATTPAAGLRPQVNNDPNGDGTTGEGGTAPGSGAAKPQALGTTKATPGDGLAELGKANLPQLHANQPNQQQPASGEQADKDGASKGLDPAGLAQQAKQLATHPQALLGKAKGGYQQLEDKATVWVGKASQKAGFHWSEKLTKRVTRSMIVAMTGGALWGGVAMGNYQQRPLDDGAVCSTLNTGDESYEGAGDINAQAGGWNKENEVKVWKFFKKKGFSGMAIAGIMGNLAQESGFRPDATSGIADDIGIIQWTDNAESNAKTRLMSWARNNHKDYKSLSAQLEYLWAASSSARTANGVAHNTTLIKGLMNAKSVKEAADLWEEQIEGAGNKMMANRYAYGEQIYAEMHGSSVKGDKHKLESLLSGATDALATENAATAEKANTANCKNVGDDNTSDGNIVNTARKIKDKLHWTYDQTQRNDWSDSKKFDEVTKFSELKDKGHSDCSSFVDVVYQLCGYKTPHGAGNAWTTISMMDTYSKGDNKMLEEVPAEKAKAGDAAVGNQHAVIITEDWHGDDTKDIESAVPGQGIDESTLGWHPDKGALHFYHPIKK